jgi:hypothetical protein
MSYLESAFIPIEEYSASEKKRLLEGEFAVDAFYTAMYALAPNYHKYQAAKCSVQLLKIERRTSGLYKVIVGLLDLDLKLCGQRNATFLNGHWTNADDMLVYCDSQAEGLAVEMAHIKSYRDEFDKGLDNLEVSLSLDLRPLSPV